MLTLLYSVEINRVKLDDAVQRDFLENNYKTQTISLVRKRFKLIWYLAIRVQKTRFLGLLFIILPPVEANRMARNRVHWTRFLSLENEFMGLGFKA